MTLGVRLIVSSSVSVEVRLRLNDGESVKDSVGDTSVFVRSFVLRLLLSLKDSVVEPVNVRVIFADTVSKFVGLTRLCVIVGGCDNGDCDRVSVGSFVKEGDWEVDAEGVRDSMSDVELLADNDVVVLVLRDAVGSFDAESLEDRDVLTVAVDDCELLVESDTVTLWEGVVLRRTLLELVASFDGERVTEEENVSEKVCLDNV